MKQRKNTGKTIPGIVATINRGVRGLYGRRSPRTFFFATRLQGAVECAMSFLGYGGDQYSLSYGKLEKVDRL